MLRGAFGEDVGRWYMLLQICQFHVLFYASRTLPNMFAFGLSELTLLILDMWKSLMGLYSYARIRRIPASKGRKST
jgi:hypothetical protein